MVRFTVKVETVRDIVYVTVWDNKRNERALDLGKSKFVREPGFLETMFYALTFREISLQQKVRKVMYKMQLLADKMNNNDWEYDHAERVVKEIEGDNKNV